MTISSVSVEFSVGIVSTIFFVGTAFEKKKKKRVWNGGMEAE